mgnify:CR=1 FL=1
MIPMIGILGNAFMIYNIDSSWEVKKRIYLIFVITVAILSVYAVIWIKCVMKPHVQGVSDQGSHGDGIRPVPDQS